MSRLNGLTHRLRVLLRGERYANEQAREIAFHLELEMLAHSTSARQHERDSLDDAEFAARRTLGNITYYREEARRMTLLSWMDRLRQDASYALRGIRRAPAFTATVMLTLALGVGVNAAMFSLLETMFFRAPDGVVAPEKVRRIYVAPRECHGESGCFMYGVFRYGHFRALVKATPSTPIAAFTPVDSISAQLEGAQLEGAQLTLRSVGVTRSYFGVLGVKPEIGRFFAADEDEIAAPAFVAVISDQLWRTALAADPNVLGRQLAIGHRTYTIVGVAPRGFRGTELSAVDSWLPLSSDSRSSLRPLNLVARIHSATDEPMLAGFATNTLRTVSIQSTKPDPNESAVVGPIIAARAPIKRTAEVDVLTRIAAVALVVLAIALANVMNLLLLRATRRRREIGLRRALGVSNGRLIGQLVVEGLALSLVSGVGAVIIAIWSGAALRHLVLPSVHWAHSPIDLSTVGFILVVSVATGVIAGLAPAASTLSANVIESLKAGQREAGYQRSPLRSLLLVAQAALSMILLVGAGLFLQSFQNVRSIDIGYDVSNVLDLSPVYTQRSPEQNLAERAGIPEVVRRLEHVSGVEAVGYANGAPLGSFLVAGLTIPDRDTIPHGPGGLVPSVNGVSTNYFSAAGMRIISGRSFATSDGAAAPHVAIVSETMARVVWPDESAIGKCIIIGKRDGPCSTIVGIASDAHRLNVIEPPAMFVYFPVAQGPPGWLTPGNLIIRTRQGDLDRVTSVARRALQATIPLADGIRVTRLEDTVEQQLRPWRLGAVIFTAFGVLACIVAAVGVYSVVAYGVAQRTHEMGVRIALGAQAKQIVDLVLADGLHAVIIGVAIGIAASLLLGPLVRSLLFGVTPSDPSSFIAAGVALSVLGAVASIVPALRAARVDPIVALRSE